MATSSFMGMEVEQVKGMAGSLEQQAAHLTSIISSLSATLSSTAWRGPDRDKFVDEWQNHQVPLIRKAISDMQSTSEQVRANITLQIRTSGN